MNGGETMNNKISKIKKQKNLGLVKEMFPLNS